MWSGVVWCGGVWCCGAGYFQGPLWAFSGTSGHSWAFSMNFFSSLQGLRGDLDNVPAQAAGVSQNDPKEPKRALEAVHGRESRPHFHEKTPRERRTVKFAAGE